MANVPWALVDGLTEALCDGPGWRHCSPEHNAMWKRRKPKAGTPEAASPARLRIVYRRLAGTVPDVVQRTQLVPWSTY
jgi:hypothetical protein